VGRNLDFDPLPLSACQRAAAPAGRRIPAPVPLTARSHLSAATSSLPLPFSPFLLPLLSPAGTAVERARPCSHVHRHGWPPRVRISIVPSNPPTTAYIRAATAAYPPNRSRSGIPPQSRAADICGVKEWGEKLGSRT
jgi:hypothetical protein